MGTSTTSTSIETTINTSTESASTLVTNVTATDTSETFDSLDLGKLLTTFILNMTSHYHVLINVSRHTVNNKYNQLILPTLYISIKLM